MQTQPEPGMQVTPAVRLVRPLGTGGMASVWVGMHAGLDAEVAVKFLRGPHADDEKMRARFAREAMTAARVKSAHVVKVHDAGLTDGGVPYLVMELLEGTDLAARLAAGPIPHAEVVTIVRQLCRALARAHEVGIIHRDVKPGNVHLGSEGGETFVKLLDFGIAKSEALLRREGANRSTAVTELLGTPYYMSPEQMRSAKQIDHRSDLFSVGVVVYEMLTGTLPFEGETLSALAITIDACEAKPPSAVDPSLPASVDDWFATACAREPADRFASATELADALAAALNARSDAPRTESATSIPALRAAREARTEAETLGPLLETGAPSVRAASTEPTPRASRPWVPIAAAIGALAVAATIALSLRGRAPAAALTAASSGSATAAEPSSASLVVPAPSAAPPSPSAPASITATSGSGSARAASVPASTGARATVPAVSASAPSVPSATASIAHGDIW